MVATQHSSAMRGVILKVTAGGLAKVALADGTALWRKVPPL
jgi:hypothetical protein